MKAIKFDESIFDMLVRCGFRYCYSKTVADEQAPEQVSIFLTPVGFKPDIRRLPDEYDTYFHLKKEPKQMAGGIDGETAVYINLNDTLIGAYYGQEDTDH